MRIFSLVVMVACGLPGNVFADAVFPIDEVENYVNIRSAPDDSADVVNRLSRGSSLPHIGTTDGWREVRIEGEASGFVSEQWTIVVKQEEPAAITVGSDETDKETNDDVAALSGASEIEMDDGAIDVADGLKTEPDEDLTSIQSVA